MEAANPTERQVHLLDYWQVLVKRRWAIYSALLLVTGLVTLGSFLVQPQYTATAQLQIEKFNPKVLPFQDVMASYIDYRDDFYETQSRLIQSRSVARAVVRRLELAKHPSFALPPANGNRTAEEQQNLLAAIVQGGTKVALIRNSRLLNIAYTGPDPELAARIVNALANSYIEFNASNAYNTSERASASMGRLIETLTGEIDEKERELQEYAR